MAAGNQTMNFAYDADGQRVMTTCYDETKVYTPFPDYEMEDPPTGANIIRTTYRLAGQVVAVGKNSGGGNIYYHTLTDRLGSILILLETNGNQVAGSYAAYEPFGSFMVVPTTNQGTTSHGFTGHRHNNTAPDYLGLIYMNAVTTCQR